MRFHLQPGFSPWVPLCIHLHYTHLDFVFIFTMFCKYMYYITNTTVVKKHSKNVNVIIIYLCIQKITCGTAETIHECRNINPWKSYIHRVIKRFQHDIICKILHSYIIKLHKTMHNAHIPALNISTYNSSQTTIIHCSSS